MISNTTAQHIRALGDAALLEYVMIGTRHYQPDAVEFAAAELANRKLSDDVLASYRPMILKKLFQLDMLRPSIDSSGNKVGAIICQCCGVEAPTAEVSYSQNIGMFIARQWKTRKGFFCRKCNRKIFTEFTLVTLTIGWFSVISFFVSIAFIISNVVNRITTSKLPLDPDARKPELNDAAVDKLSPYVPHIADQLRIGANTQQLARSVAASAGVTPGQAWQFIGSIIFRNNGPTLATSPVAVQQSAQ